MNPVWFLRMSRWVRRPPSRQRLMIVLAVLAIALAIFGLEYWGLWPDWAKTERVRRLRVN